MEEEKVYITRKLTTLELVGNLQTDREMKPQYFVPLDPYNLAF
jgi:hypothetical protein